MEIEKMSTQTESSPADIYRGEHYCDDVLSGLKSLLDNKQFCDVVLVAGNDEKRFDAHRLLLSSASEYFSAMFCGPMRESKEHEVKLHDVSGDTLELLVHYFYTGCIELRVDTVESVLVAADIFLLSDVVTACWNFMERHLDATNCLGFASFAEQRSYEKLEKSAKAFVYMHFEEVYKNDEFLQLNFKELAEIIASDKLTVPSEEDVFKSVLKWIEHDNAARKQYFGDLLCLLRLPLLQPAFIVKFVIPVCVTEKNKELLLHAVLCRLQPDLNECLQINSRIRSGANILLAVDREAFNIQSYCPLTDKWDRWNTPSYKGKLFHVAVLDDNIMLAGGLGENLQFSKNIWRLNLKTNDFTRFALSNKLRNVGGVASLHGSLYAIESLDVYENKLRNVGGVASLRGSLYAIESLDVYENDQKRLVERWDPKTPCWSSIESMIRGRRNFGVAVLNKHLYVVGGITNDHSLSCVEFYDPLTKVWKNAASMNVARSVHGVAAVNDFLYAVGGIGICFSIERYDPRTDIWTMINTANAPHFKNNVGFSCTNLEDCLIISDGQNCLHEYDTIKEKWRKLPRHDGCKNQVALVTIPYTFSLAHPNNSALSKNLNSV